MVEEVGEVLPEGVVPDRVPPVAHPLPLLQVLLQVVPPQVRIRQDVLVLEHVVQGLGN